MWEIRAGRAAIRADFWLLPLLLFLAAPPMVPLAVFFAALLHELGHLALMACFGVELRELRLSLFGAEINAPRLRYLSYWRELCVTLAGSAVNFAAAFCLGQFAARCDGEELYLFAGAQLLLGLFNLLPVLPLDGGRALHLLCAWAFGPFAADGICAAAGIGGGGLFLAVGLWLFFFQQAGALFPMAAGVLFLAAIRQLGLAKAP